MVEKKISSTIIDGHEISRKVDFGELRKITPTLLLL